MTSKSKNVDKTNLDKNPNKEQKWKKSKEISERSLSKVQGGTANKSTKAGGHLGQKEANIWIFSCS